MYFFLLSSILIITSNYGIAGYQIDHKKNSELVSLKGGLVDGLVIPALFWAIANNDTAEIERLIKSGIDINQTAKINSRTYSALAYASVSEKETSPKKIMIVERLISAGAKADVFAPVLEASSLEIIRRLADAGANLDQKCSNPCHPSLSGQSALHLRAGEGNWKAIELLASLGANVDSVNLASETPLIQAVKYSVSGRLTLEKSKKVLGALINAGSDLDKGDHNKLTALFHAINFSQSQVGNFPMTAFDILIDAGANIFAKDRFGRTVVHFAAGLPAARRPNANGQLQVFASLFTAGGDASLFDLDLKGETPLFEAVKPTRYLLLRSDILPLIKLLLTRGALPDHRDNKGYTAIMKLIPFACRAKGRVSPWPTPRGSNRKPYLDVIKALLEAGADPLAIAHDGKTAKKLTSVNSSLCSDIHSLLRRYEDRDAIQSRVPGLLR